MAQDTLYAVILTALPVEFVAVRAFLSQCKVDVHPTTQTVYERGTFVANGQTWTVDIMEIGPGNVNSAIETTRALEHFKPHVILFVGVAGGIKDVQIGDVVVATKIYNYASGKAETAVFKSRPDYGKSSDALVQRARAEARCSGWLQRRLRSSDSEPSVYVRPIASGEKVVASTQSAVCDILRSHYSDAVAVEMEGYGFLEAVDKDQQRVSAMVVRGISDLIDRKNDNTEGESESIRQQKASEHASAFAFQILANFNPKVGLIDPQFVPCKVGDQAWDELFQCFQDSDLPIMAPLCQQVFEESLTPEQRDQYLELTQLSTVQVLRTVFERRDDLDIAVIWVGRVIHAFENPSEGGTQRPVPPALQAWYDEHLPSQSESKPVKKSPGYLLITLDPKDDEDTVAFTAELHAPDGTVKTDLLPPGAQCSMDEPYEDLFQLLSEAIRQARNIKSIEIFLSWRHLHKPVHEWQASAGLVMKPLKRFRNTLVRSLDRVTLRDYLEEWCATLEKKWIRLQGCSDADLGDHCHEVMTLDCDDLEDVFQDDSRHLILKLLSVLPEDEEELKNLLNIMLLSGIPIWFWSYHTPSDVETLSKAIDALLTAHNLKDAATLAEAIRKERKNLPNLGLLCDCPTRLPKWVDWKSGRLRQPAA